MNVTKLDIDEQAIAAARAEAQEVWPQGPGYPKVGRKLMLTNQDGYQDTLDVAEGYKRAGRELRAVIG